MIDTESELDNAVKDLQNLEWRLAKFVEGNPRIYSALLAVAEARIHIAELKEPVK